MVFNVFINPILNKERRVLGEATRPGEYPEAELRTVRCPGCKQLSYNSFCECAVDLKKCNAADRSARGK